MNAKMKVDPPKFTRYRTYKLDLPASTLKSIAKTLVVETNDEAHQTFNGKYLTMGDVLLGHVFSTGFINEKDSEGEKKRSLRYYALIPDYSKESLTAEQIEALRAEAALKVVRQIGRQFYYTMFTALAHIVINGIDSRADLDALVPEMDLYHSERWDAWGNTGSDHVRFRALDWCVNGISVTSTLMPQPDLPAGLSLQSKQSLRRLIDFYAFADWFTQYFGLPLALKQVISERQESNGNQYWHVAWVDPSIDGYSTSKLAKCWDMLAPRNINGKDLKDATGWNADRARWFKTDMAYSSRECICPRTWTAVRYISLLDPIAVGRYYREWRGRHLEKKVYDRKTDSWALESDLRKVGEFIWTPNCSRTWSSYLKQDSDPEKKRGDVLLLSPKDLHPEGDTDGSGPVTRDVDFKGKPAANPTIHTEEVIGAGRLYESKVFDESKYRKNGETVPQPAGHYYDVEH